MNWREFVGKFRERVGWVKRVDARDELRVLEKQHEAIIQNVRNTIRVAKLVAAETVGIQSVTNIYMKKTESKLTDEPQEKEIYFKVFKLNSEANNCLAGTLPFVLDGAAEELSNYTSLYDGSIVTYKKIEELEAEVGGVEFRSYSFASTLQEDIIYLSKLAREVIDHDGQTLFPDDAKKRVGSFLSVLTKAQLDMGSTYEEMPFTGDYGTKGKWDR